MKLLTRIVPALALVLALTGCIEIYDEYSLNPDGSGKVERRTVVSGMAFEAFGGGGDAKTQARQNVREMLNDSTGVEAWKDIRYEVRPDGKTEIFATAYFSDLNALDLAGGMGGPSDRPRLERHPDGSLTLTLAEDEEDPEEPMDMPERDEAELLAEVERSRSEFQASKPFMQAMLGGMVLDTAFRLPAPPSEFNNFRQDGDLLRVTLKGEDMMSAIETLMQDTDWMLEQARLGRGDDLMSGTGETDRLNEMVFGAPGPVRAEIPAGAAPLFDYATEVAEAQEAFPEMLAALGMEPPVPAAPAQEGGFTELLVAGVQWVRYDNPDDGIRPFNEQAGYKLCLVGRFDGAVLSVDEGVVTEAVADNGQDLLPASEWNRRISWPRLSESGTAVVFEVPLVSPGADARGLSRVAGTLQYRVATSTEEVDIGIDSFVEGATGRRFGALVEEVGPRAWGDGNSLTLRVERSADQIQEALFFRQDGTPIPVDRGSTMQMGGTSSLEFVTEGEFPATGRIVLKVFSDMKTYEAPFVLEDLDLMGQPR